MRTILAGRCVRRTSLRRQEPIATWAKAVIADPAAHYATEREASYIASLLAELEAAR